MWQDGDGDSGKRLKGSMEDRIAGGLEEADEAALWRRWRAATPGGGAAEPSPLELAAYAEDRLSEAAAEAIEAWLATNPLAAEDVIAARRAARSPLPEAAEDIMARAGALVGGGAEILPFRRPAVRQSWRKVAGWGAMAASIVAASLIGVTLSSETYVLSAGNASASFGQQLIDPPMGLFNGLDEDSNT
jgi:hypothetical protein